MNIGHFFQATEAKHTKFRMALDHAEQATVRIGATVSSIHLSPLPPESESLMEGELGYIGELIAEDEGDAHRQIVIRDEVHNVSYHGPELRFVIRVHPRVTLDLNVGTASGDIHLELQVFALTALDVRAASGAVWAALPAAPAAYPVHVGVASGDVSLKLADQTRLSSLAIDTASGHIRLKAGAGTVLPDAKFNSASGDMRLELQSAASAAVKMSAVSGDVTVQLPEQAAARVVVKHMLSGDIRMRSDLRRLSGGAHSGMWETASYRADTPGFSIHVASVVSGDVRVQ